MPRLKNRDGKVIQLTAEEETIRDAQEAQALIDEQVAADAQSAYVTNKASGKQKLRDLGLDDDEIKALTGA